MALPMILFRARTLPAGGALNIFLGAEGAGRGEFLVGPAGSRRGLRLNSPIGEQLLLSRIAVSDRALCLIVAAPIEILEIQVYVDVSPYGLRGEAEVPAGATLQVMTAHDRTTVVEDSSWWVTFQETSGPDAPPARSTAAKAPAGPEK